MIWRLFGDGLAIVDGADPRCYQSWNVVPYRRTPTKTQAVPVSVAKSYHIELELARRVRRTSETAAGNAMLRKEQNDLATQTGPGTPMGQLSRCYWLPALMADELPENECPPVRLKILSERLLAFRDTDGRYGLIDEFCAHRGVSLWFGRNEEHGLRCPYHGWKYDVNGQCVDVPSEPVESGFCEKIKLKSYPLVKRGPLLWTYMGPADKQPPLPEWEFATVPAEQTFISKRLQDCNWLQAMEGGIDSSHVSFLHRGDLGSDPLFKGA